MYSSEEVGNRKRADEMLGEKKVKNFRPKAVVNQSSSTRPRI
jgi:hypothetical protein